MSRPGQDMLRTGAAAPSPGARLRALLASGNLITAPGVYDGLTAALVAKTGFPAAYLTGAGVAVAIGVAIAVGLGFGGKGSCQKWAWRVQDVVRCCTLLLFQATGPAGVPQVEATG